MCVRSLVIAATLLCVSQVCRADIMYSYVGTDEVNAGDTFTIISPTFLTYSDQVIPATGTFAYNPLDIGPVSGVQFYDNQTLEVNAERDGETTIHNVWDSNTATYDIGKLGTYLDGSGDMLTISLAPVVMGSTPEPSTFALLGTGLVGVTVAVRRRFGRPSES